MSSRLFDLLVDLLAAVLFAVFLVAPVEKIRAYLATRESGRVRNKYIKIFIGAVRGEGVVFDTTVLAALIFSVPFIMALWHFSGAWEIERDRQALQRQYDLLTAIRSGAKLEITNEKLQALNAEVERRVPALLQREEQMVLTRNFLSIGWALVGVYLLLFWFPYVLIRKRFEHELTRFMLRIQGLASKAELAELAVAEGQVADEQSLRSFVDKVKAIAVRHEVPQLVSTFDLWKTEPK